MAVPDKVEGHENVCQVWAVDPVRGTVIPVHLPLLFDSWPGFSFYMILA